MDDVVPFRSAPCWQKCLVSKSAVFISLRSGTWWPDCQVMGKVKVDFITDTSVISLTGLHRGCSPKIWPQSFICLSYCSLLHGREEMRSSLMLLLWFFFFYIYYYYYLFPNHDLHFLFLSFFGMCCQFHHCVVRHQGQKPESGGNIKATCLNCLNPKEAKLDSTLRGRALPFVTGWISCSISGMPE